MTGVGGGKGDFLRCIDYFLLTFSLYEFFRSGHEYFFRITWGACEFVFDQFPLVRILFFCTSPAITPHKFSNGLSLQLLNEMKRATPKGILLTN